MVSRHWRDGLKNLILASQSPARKKWLAKIVRVRFPDMKFSVKPADLDEAKLLRKLFGAKARDLKTARKMASTLARAKAAAVFSETIDGKSAARFKQPPHLLAVLGSDQLLWIDGKVLGKPKTEARARRMLKLCSEKKAYLVTSVALVSYDETSRGRGRIRTRVKTQVTVLNFAKLNSRDISRVVKLDQPLSCAGSFMFEAHGATLFKSVQTDDPTGIEGFPVMRVIALLSFY